jgi:hypothetical protein
LLLFTSKYHSHRKSTVVVDNPGGTAA